MKKIIINIFKRFGYTINKIRKENPDSFLPVVAMGKAIIKKISPEYKVLNGPFKGMRYPSIDITELTLAPKIAGSYEFQLQDLINGIAERPYDTIIDVGCAEGYYAVGLAMLMPSAIVHAFDINETDLAFCRKMAELNNVRNMKFGEFCSPQTLIDFNFGRKSLIFCDCEGYELELFTEKAIRALKDSELIIELHDVINPIISKTLISRFKNTHDVRLYNNSNISTAHLSGMDILSPGERAFAVYEHRGGLYQNIFMEWGYFTPKTKLTDVAT